MVFFENLIRHFVFITYVCGPYAATLCLFDHLISVQTEKKNPSCMTVSIFVVTMWQFKYVNIKDTHLLQVFASFSFTFTTYCSILFVFHWLTVINKIRETNNYAQKK